MVGMATAQRTRPRAVVAAPRRAAWQLKTALRHSISAAPRTKICLHFFKQLLLVIFSLRTTMVSLDVAILYKLKTMHATITGKGAFGSSLFF